MRFEQIQNIWDVDPKMLSNIDRGRLFVERAKSIVNDVLADPSKSPLAIQGNRFRRSYLVRAIGCRPGFLAESVGLRELVHWADVQLAEKSGIGRFGRLRIRTRIETLESALDQLRSVVLAQGEEIERLKLRLQNWNRLDRPLSDARIARDMKRTREDSGK